jgi:ribosomal protein L28
MMKFVLPALAAAGTAFAECSTSATMTVQNAGDASAVATCSTFSGSIAIATGTTDDISFGGIKVLNGNLVAPANANIKRIGATDLEQLNGEMNLDGLTRLNGVDFPKLKKVNSIKWNALPNLQSIGFTASVEQAKKVDIQNTAIRSLTGINIQQAETLKIANNGYINDITMQLGNVSSSLDFSDNNKAVKVSLPNLIWASNLTFRFCGSVSVPSLAKLNGSLGLYNNGFESFSAPNLTEVGEALAIVGNDQLNNLTFPLLTKINDDLKITNNSALMTVDGLPLLKSIGGAFDISGNMTKVETPALNSVIGAFNIQSSDNVTASCDKYKPLKDKKLIQGSYVCRGKLVNPSTEGTKPTDQSGDKPGAASTLSATNGALGFAAMAAVFLL